jgi:hypothetical protein
MGSRTGTPIWVTTPITGGVMHPSVQTITARLPGFTYHLYIFVGQLNALPTHLISLNVAASQRRENLKDKSVINHVSIKFEG